MDNPRPWGFFLIIIIVLFSFSLYTFNFEMFFTKNNVTENGLLIGIEKGYDTRGNYYNKYIEYIFFVDKKMYKGRSKISIREKEQNIGNTITVKYSVKKPETNEIILFHNKFKNSNERVFLSTIDNNYNSITLVNGVYFLKKYIKGKLLEEEMGRFKEENKKLILTPFLNKNFKVFIFENENRLLELKTNRIYR